MPLLRARDEPSKRSRRSQLLAAAATRLDAVGFAATTMAAVAAEAGLAKGTTYLYFRSKEALFLELLLEAQEEWATAASDALRDAVAGSSGGIAKALAETLAARPRLVRLLALRAPVLEPGAGAEAAHRFRTRQHEQLEPLAAKLEALLPSLGARGGYWHLLRLLALAAGFADRLEPETLLRSVVGEDQLAAVRPLRFLEEIETCLRWLLAPAARSASAPGKTDERVM
jgi:AcrR family transcriptional regulator